MIERLSMPDPDLDEICRVLGVPRDADAATVKKAYRALAVQYHPDRNPDDAEARRRFDEANHAYATWSARQGSDEQPAPGATGGMPFETAGFEDLFAEFFGGVKASARRGADRRMPLRLSSGDAMVGCRREISITRSVFCGACKGSGDASGDRSACTSCNGTGSVEKTAGMLKLKTTCDVCRGVGRVAKRPCKSCKDGLREIREQLKVTVPIGVTAEQVLRIPGKGDEVFGGAAGDLYLSIEVDGPSTIMRRDSDAVLEVFVDLRQLLFGGNMNVQTLDGETSVKVPRGVRDGARLALTGRGYPRATGAATGSTGDPYRGDVARGDQIVVFRVPPAVQQAKSKLVIVTVVSAVVAAMIALMQR